MKFLLLPSTDSLNYEVQEHKSHGNPLTQNYCLKILEMSKPHQLPRLPEESPRPNT